MPRKRATRVNKHAKPKNPEGEIPGNPDVEERQKKLNGFLRDFDLEVQARLKNIEKEKERLKSMIDKQVSMQLASLAVEIRTMNVMDFLAAGGTVESALMKMNENGEGDSFVDENFGKMPKKKEQTARKRKGSKVSRAPPSTAKSPAKIRSRFQTPATRQLPAVWNTPAITPKFDINLPFTPGFARAPRHGERVMSLAGSPVDISHTYKISRTMKHTRVQEEDDIDSATSRIAASVPGLTESDIRKILVEYTGAT